MVQHTVEVAETYKLFMVYLYSHDTDVLALALGWMSQLFTRFTACLPSSLQSELYLLHSRICRSSRSVRWSGQGLWKVIVYTIMS